ncbi:response regulator transcription factor [Pectinatus brassicae]|uniref:DNA-binding response OmpR family regulator n=1 Tax=Pectinatus brassicae TaxID=862415 RepID=A0A840UW44_9FIRM|nr:response regulator transcription factor [Pectinatus brassicae]MBB5337113.1 DNA-binding response OmpR family regulator [Pectinatus brassicae]
MNKILIIEDDIDIAMIEKDYLEMDGFIVEIATNGISGLEKSLNEKFDLILLDLMLPGMDGFSICKKLRKHLSIPILIVSARQDDNDKIRGLGIGADDYIEKPFSPSVLAARVKANISQYKRLNSKEENEIIIGPISIETKSRRVFVNGNEKYLKNKEYELLLFMAKNIDIVFTRETLYERIWGINALGESATVAVHINRLREKIQEDPANPQYVQTVWGVGYRFKV